MAGRATSRVVWEKVTVLNGPMPDATYGQLAGLAAPTPTGCGGHYCSVANFGLVRAHAAFGRVFPSAEAPRGLATALHELWQVCIDEGHEPLHNTGKVRGGQYDAMVRKHEALARTRLGSRTASRTCSRA